MAVFNISGCPDIINPVGSIGEGLFPLSDGYGMRGVHPVTGEPSFHHGIDIVAPYGTRINAVKDGKVTFTGYDPGGYGNWIQIRHNDGTYSRYAHLSEIRVNPQQEVYEGDYIGNMGNTGGVTGTHLHFEIRDSNQLSIDPEPCYLNARTNWKDPNLRRAEENQIYVSQAEQQEYAPAYSVSPGSLTTEGKYLLAGGLGLSALLLVILLSTREE